MGKTFAEEVNEGLSAASKHLSSMYFYDDEGSRIFQEIMLLPDYYPSDSEFEILNRQGEQIHGMLGFNGHFNIIELGAGDGLKTTQLLSTLLDLNVNFTYMPVDISAGALEQLQRNMQAALPNLKVSSQVGDYFNMMDKVVAEGDSPNLVLFLGGNIGNFKDEWALDLMEQLNAHMKSGDKLLIGIDLQKNPNIIKNAYDDKHGVTKRFNLNLLHRINRELQGEFDVEKFDFYCHYNPLNGEVRSYLVSLEDQRVKIGALEKKFHLRRNELISTELSKKYALHEIEELAKKSGFRFVHHFIDSREYFTDTLLEKP